MRHKEILVNKDPNTFNKLDELVNDIIDDNKPFNDGDKQYKNYTEYKKENINTLIFNNTDKKKFNKLSKLKLIEKVN